MSSSGPDPLRMSHEWLGRHVSRLARPIRYKGTRECIVCGTILHAYNPNVRHCSIHTTQVAVLAVVECRPPETPPEVQGYRLPCPRCKRTRHLTLSEETLAHYIARRPYCFICTPPYQMRRFNGA